MLLTFSQKKEVGISRKGYNDHRSQNGPYHREEETLVKKQRHSHEIKNTSKVKQPALLLSEMIEKLNGHKKLKLKTKEQTNKTRTQLTTGASCFGETLSSIHILAMEFFSFADALFVIVMTSGRN